MRSISAVGLIVFTVSVTACGGGDDDDQGRELIVSAASSLQIAFSSYAEEGFPGDEIRQSFAGSDELSAQIRQGLRPDVFAAANTDLPEELHSEGLVESPKVFAGNELVIAVPAGSEIDELSDLTEPGVTIVVGDDEVPVGGYTREVLDRLPDAQRLAILGNVRSEEPEVAFIIGKLTQGAADAGFVYRTDVAAVEDELDLIELPPRLQPVVAYGIAVVHGAPNPDLAREFISGLIEGSGADALRDAGFLPPP